MAKATRARLLRHLIRASQRAGEQVRAILAAHGEARFTPIGKGFAVEVDGEVRETARVDERSKTVDRLGYRRVVVGADGEEQTEFLIYPERWRDTVCKGFDAVRVARLLLEKGHLIPGEKAASGLKLRRNVRVPGHGLGRFYCLRDGVLSNDDEET